MRRSDCAGIDCQAFSAAVVVVNQTNKCEKGKKKIQIGENRESKGESNAVESVVDKAAS
jgi:hypothetical protein